MAVAIGAEEHRQPARTTPSAGETLRVETAAVLIPELGEHLEELRVLQVRLVSNTGGEELRPYVAMLRQGRSHCAVARSDMCACADAQHIAV
jgi:hypothetical protein